MADEDVLAKLRALLKESPGLGYRKLHASLKETPEFSEVGLKRVQALLKRLGEEAAEGGGAGPAGERPEKQAHGPMACTDLADCSVEIAERDDVGRYLRVTRPVRRGEALLVEEPLYASPADATEWEALAKRICDKNALAEAGYGVGTGKRPSSSEQLTLVVADALAAPKGEGGSLERFLALRGDQARWAERAERLGALLKPSVRRALGEERLLQAYAIVASNAHEASRSVAAVCDVGSMCEHSCAPSAFKELVRVNGGPWSPWRLVVRALRDLAVGDVVSLSYVPEYQPTYKRRELLHSMYGFACGCERCKGFPELACSFECPGCGGPVSPTGPVAFGADEFSSLAFRCGECGKDFPAGSPEIADFATAERSQEFGEGAVHQYHHKIVNVYMAQLSQLPAAPRVQVLEQCLEAHHRLCRSEAAPVLARLLEHLARAHAELGDGDEAAAAWLRAGEMFALTHSGAPDEGHVTRCQAAAGRSRSAVA